MSRISARVFAAVGLLFVASGMSGLVFEVIWVRYLTLVVGHTTFAASLVVSAFLAGLVLGSLGLGRLADGLKRPCWRTGCWRRPRACSRWELLGAGHAAGAALPLGLPGGGPLPLRGVLAFLLVLPPTFVMGGTLPVLMRFVARELEGLGRSFGVLYSLNTLGAALGCGLAGFYLIGAVGLWRTAALAAGLNRLVGVAVFLLHLWLRPDPPASAPAPASAAPEASSVFHGARRTLLVAAFALCGFASISYEVLWFRVLSTSLDSTTYAFTILLVTFLLGLVVGGLVYSLKLAGRVRELELFVSGGGACCPSRPAVARAAGHVPPGGQGALGAGRRLGAPMPSTWACCCTPRSSSSCPRPSSASSSRWWCSSPPGTWRAPRATWACCTR